MSKYINIFESRFERPNALGRAGATYADNIVGNTGEKASAMEFAGTGGTGTSTPKLSTSFGRKPDIG